MVNGKVSEFKTEEIYRSIKGREEKGIRLEFKFEKDSQIQELFLLRGQKKIALFAAQSVENDWQGAEKGFQTIFDSLEINLDR